MTQTISRREQDELDELLRSCISELEEHGPGVPRKLPGRLLSSHISQEHVYQQPFHQNGGKDTIIRSSKMQHNGLHGSLSSPTSPKMVEVHEYDRPDSGLSIHEYQTISRAISPTQSESNNSVIYAKIRKTPTFASYNNNNNQQNGGHLVMMREHSSPSHSTIVEPVYSKVYRRAQSDKGSNYNNGFSPKSLNSSMSIESEKLDEVMSSLLKEVESIPDMSQQQFKRSNSLRFQSVSPAPVRRHHPVRSTSLAGPRTVHSPIMARSNNYDQSPAREMSPNHRYQVGRPDYLSNFGQNQPMDSSNMSDISSIYHESLTEEQNQNLTWLEKQQLKLRKSTPVTENPLHAQLISELRGSFKLMSPRSSDGHLVQSSERLNTLSSAQSSPTIRPTEPKSPSNYRTPLYVQTNSVNYGGQRKSLNHPKPANQVTELPKPSTPLTTIKLNSTTSPGFNRTKSAEDTTTLWYKPHISRDEAITILLPAAPGSFVVRDSNSFPGAFGLAIKVAAPPVAETVSVKALIGRMENPNPAEELVRHFLIEPHPNGVRIKGCPNEPVFPSLSALVHQHTKTRLALPEELVLPDGKQ
ncbi:Tensin [Halotydeus destructor]|nr:Tensin [Halotydeus destructor]